MPYNKKYVGEYLRCDNCGASYDSQQCCEFPYHVYVSYLKSEELTADGAVETDNPQKSRTEYVLPNGDVYTQDYSGWATDFNPVN